MNVSGQQFCQFPAVAENKTQQGILLGKHIVALGIKKRKWLETPLEEIASSDKLRYAE